MSETININGKVWYSEQKKNEIEVTENIISEKGVAAHMIGKNVIVRSRNEGINCGTVIDADSSGVCLKNVRRLWHHKPKNPTLSWYEGVAVSGLSDDSKISCTVDSKIILEDYSMTLVSEEAYKSIMEKTCVDSN